MGNTLASNSQTTTISKSGNNCTTITKYQESHTHSSLSTSHQRQNETKHSLPASLPTTIEQKHVNLLGRQDINSNNKTEYKSITSPTSPPAVIIPLKEIQESSYQSNTGQDCNDVVNTVKIWGSKYHVIDYKTRKTYTKATNDNQNNELKEIDVLNKLKGEETELDIEENIDYDVIQFLGLPELVLDLLLSYLDVHSLLLLRRVCSSTKSLVERLPHVLRLIVQIDSFQILKTISSPDTSITTEWSNFHFHDRIREMSGPTTISNTPEWDHTFSRWLSKYRGLIQHFSSDALLTFSEVDRIMSIKGLKSCHIPGYVYSIEHIMNTKRTLGKYDNLIVMVDELRLENLSRLRIEGCTTLTNLLARAPNLSYLCVTSAIGANSKVQPRGFRDSHYTKAIWEALCFYVKARFHPLQARRTRNKLVIDFGGCKTDRLTFQEEDGLLEMFYALCYPVGVIELVNVRSKWLPKLAANNNGGLTIAPKTFSKSYTCIKSVYIDSNLLGRYVPGSVKEYNAGLSIVPFWPQTAFQLPEVTIVELSVYDVHEGASKIELSQVLRPRLDLLRLSLQYETSPLFDEMLDFSFFTNLRFLQIGKFPGGGKKFWELCKHLKRLETLQIKEIKETALLTKSAGEPLPAITKLKELRHLSIKRAQLSDKTLTALNGMHLATLSLPKTESKISVEAIRLINGILASSLKSLEISTKESLTAEEIEGLKLSVTQNCRRLGTITIYCNK